MTVNPDLINGLEITVVGLLGVFSVLIIFYVIVILLGKLSSREDE